MKKEEFYVLKNQIIFTLFYFLNANDINIRINEYMKQTNKKDLRYREFFTFYINEDQEHICDFKYNIINTEYNQIAIIFGDLLNKFILCEKIREKYTTMISFFEYDLKLLKEEKDQLTNEDIRSIYQDYFDYRIKLEELKNKRIFSYIKYMYKYPYDRYLYKKLKIIKKEFPDLENIKDLKKLEIIMKLKRYIE